MAARGMWQRCAIVAACVLAALGCALIAGIAVFAVEVRGTSMEPTLENGDRILVDPFHRKADVARLSTIVGEFAGGGPEIVKRVIGLPGDRVYIRKIGSAPGSVFVQPGGTGDWQRVDNPAWDGRWSLISGNCCTAAGKQSNTPEPVTVPPGSLFLLGDNLTDSDDSRAHGWAPTDAVRGTVTWRVYPIRDMGHVPGGVRLIPAP